MPARPGFTGEQDWAPVTTGNASKRTTGPVVKEKRFGAGGNSAGATTVMSAKKLDEATDVGTLAKVGKSLSQAIVQARAAKKMTQADLARLINEKPQVVGQYEQGKAIPNPQIITKMERALGTKLPRGNKSKAPPKAGGTTGGPSAQKVSTVTRGGPPKRR